MGGAARRKAVALFGALLSSPSEAHQLPTAKAESAAKEEERRAMHVREAKHGTCLVKQGHCGDRRHFGPPPVAPASWFSFSLASASASSTLKLAGF